MIGKLLRRLWCRVWHMVWTVERCHDGEYRKRCSICRRWLEDVPPAPLPLPAPLELPEGFLFDWLRDSGPLWEPGSTAFWLEPETHQELANWHARYRPDVTGVVEAAGLRIDIVPAQPKRCSSCKRFDGLTFFGDFCAECDYKRMYGLQNQMNPYLLKQCAQVAAGLPGSLSPFGLGKLLGRY